MNQIQNALIFLNISIKFSIFPVFKVVPILAEDYLQREYGTVSGSNSVSITIMID